MEMLKDKYTLELRDLDQEIETLRTNNNHDSSNADFKKREHELLQHLENYNRNVLIRKDRKFYQDKLAFSGGYAYRWQRGGWSRRGLPHRNSTYNDNTMYKSDSDMSISSSSVSSQKPQNKITRGSTVKWRTSRRGNGGGMSQGVLVVKNVWAPPKLVQDDIHRVVIMNQARTHRVTRWWVQLQYQCLPAKK